MKLSIILPYYETFSLTKDLLNRLIPQLNNDTELIIINDGSNGQEFVNMADVFINKKKNEGVTCARNDGMKIARGEYIVFIDCDDMISENYVETILNKINSNPFDLCWLSWNSPYGEAIVNSTTQINIASWGCIFKKETLENVDFNEKYNLNEEPEFWRKIFKKQNLKIEFISTIIYYYNIRENSLTRRFQRKEITELK